MCPCVYFPHFRTLLIEESLEVCHEISLITAPALRPVSCLLADGLGLFPLFASAVHSVCAGVSDISATAPGFSFPAKKGLLAGLVHLHAGIDPVFCSHGAGAVVSGKPADPSMLSAAEKVSGISGIHGRPVPVSGCPDL